MQYVGLCVFSLPISLVMIGRIYILCLIIIIKSEVWNFTHCLGLGHETMVSAVCLSTFFHQYLHTKTSSGFDGISVKLSKYASPALRQPLALIIYESLLTGIFLGKVTQNNVFYKGQCGFREDHSTEMANIELVDRIVTAPDDKTANRYLYGCIESVQHLKSRNPFVQIKILWNTRCCHWLVQ